MHMLHIAADEIKGLYKTSNRAFASEYEAEIVWRSALDRFNKGLDAENSKYVLEQCILSDPNWELSVDERMRLLNKAKVFGALSRAFLLDYYGYLAAHLDPGAEKIEVGVALEALLQAE